MNNNKKKDEVPYNIDWFKLIILLVGFIIGIILVKILMF